MANELYGRVYSVGQKVQIPSKDGSKVFYRQELVIDATTYDRYTGQRSQFENFPSVEFSNDKCALLDTLNLGDVVKIDFSLDGRFYDKKDGTQGHMNTIRGIAVKVIEASQQEQVQQMQYQEQVQQQQMQMGGYPQSPMGFQQYHPQGGMPFNPNAPY